MPNIMLSHCPGVPWVAGQAAGAIETVVHCPAAALKTLQPWLGPSILPCRPAEIAAGIPALTNYDGERDVDWRTMFWSATLSQLQWNRIYQILQDSCNGTVYKTKRTGMDPKQFLRTRQPFHPHEAIAEELAKDMDLEGRILTALKQLLLPDDSLLKGRLDAMAAALVSVADPLICMHVYLYI